MKRPRTVNKLVYEDKVVLDSLFVNLAEVRLRDGDEAVTVLEDERSIGVTPGNHGKHTTFTESIERTL